MVHEQSNMEALMVQLIAELDLSSNTGFTMDKQNLQDLLSTAKPNEMAQLRQALLEKQILLMHMTWMATFFVHTIHIFQREAVPEFLRTTRDLDRNWLCIHALKALDACCLQQISGSGYTFHPLTSCSCMALTLARAIANVSYQMTGLLFYHKDACYTPGVTPLGCWLETHLIQSVLPVTLHQSFLYQTQQALIATTCQVQQREFRRSRYECPQSMFCSDYWKRQYYKDNHNSEWDSFKMSSISGQRYGYNNYCHNKPTGFNKRRHRVKTKRGDYDSAKQQIMGQEIDSTPNWDEWDRHDVMMSVIMEKIPERFAEDWIGVICPVAKRRIVVAYNGSTCSYNKLGVLDRKFQSRLPGGNTLFVQVIKNNDMCILDCLHLKAERTFYVLDVMHWKQMPYYESETDFRFHWIKDKLAEIPLNLVDEQNEYMFKNLSRFPCTQQDIMDAMKKTRWKLPENFMFPKKKKDVAPLSSASTSLTTTVSGLYKADGDSMSNPIVISEEAYENTSVPAPVSDSRMVSDGKIAADNESVSGVTGQLSESREELKNTERHHPVP
ncbi:hypothetical protein C0Q70_20715 [Pomacea canaliculata]|uniref:Snurportin-1 n=1 Tax=Pomacea canaliculata TaxID=400727 RepID=A0A2T7NGC2_POMCA|nr:hypothetical protein C0Q70_20715 [Pomacea canaliculata]